MQAPQIASIVSHLSSLVAHPLIKRHNLGFTLNQPFAWSLINAASVLARQPSEREADHDPERIDQLKVKVASLRHFNRMIDGHNDIGMGQIKGCLFPNGEDADVPLEQIEQNARDRVKIERRSGRLAPANLKFRYMELYTGMYEAAQAKQRQLRALIDEVFFICNRSDEELYNAPQGDDESGEASKHANTTEYGTMYQYEDAKLVDFDQYGYLFEGLLDRCVQPCVRALEETQRVLDRSYRTEAIATATNLITELKKIGVEIGISWDKMAAENAAIDAEIAGVVADHNAVDESIDDELDSIDLSAVVAPEPATTTVRRTVKSPERIAREAEEARIAQVDAELKAKAATAKAKRAARKGAAE